MYYRLFFLLCFACFTFSSASSQTRLSPKFGFTFSALNTAMESIETKGRGGWDIGLDLRVERNNLIFHPGLHFQKVRVDLAQLDQQLPPEELTEESWVNSVKLPLNVGAYLTGEGSLVRVHVRGGIVPQLVVSAGEREAFNFKKDNLNDFVWGANAAVGLDFILVTAELSYEFDFTNFYENGNDKNRLAILSFGFVF